VEVTRGRLRVGSRELEGDALGVLSLAPREASHVALVGIVAATGANGLRLLDRRPYLLPEVSYPDLTVFDDRGEADVIVAAGFYGLDWSVEHGEIVWAD
jgi:hypothetical protein